MIKDRLMSMILLFIVFSTFLQAQEIGDAEWAQMAYEKGQQHETDRDWENAFRLYEAAAKRAPGSVTYCYRAAYAATQLKHSEKAYELIQPTLSKKHAPSCNLFASLLLDQGKIAQSSEWFQKALKLDPEDPVPYFGLARCAELSVKAGEGSAKSSAIAYYQAYLGRATDGAQREEAQARVRELQYGQSGVQLNRAIKVLSVGEYDRAERMLQKLTPEIKEAIYWLGMVAQSRGNDSAARDYWTQALPLPVAQLALARWIMAEGKWADALPYLQDAQRRAPKMVEITLALGRVYLELGQRKEAEKWLRNVLRDSPRHPEALRAQELLQRLGNAPPQQEPDWSLTTLTEDQLLQRYGGERHVPALLGRLEAILKRLQTGTPELSYRQFHLGILDSSVPNAWPIPPGKIFITRGLIEFVDTRSELKDRADDVLAFILGHEITHLVERDWERAGELQALVGGDLADFRVRQAILHRTEYNADRRGMLIGYQAQFDPFAAVIWCNASREQYGDIPGGSSHPSFGQRSTELQEFLLQDLVTAHQSFKRGVSLLQQDDVIHAANAFEIYLAQLPTDTEARYNLALAYFLRGIAQFSTPPWAPWELAYEIAMEPMLAEPRAKSITPLANDWLIRARTESELLLRQDQSHPAAWRLLGDIALAYRDTKAARKHYSQAMQLRANDAATHNNMGVLECLEKRWEEARRLFQKSSTSDERIKAVIRRNLSRLSITR